MIDCWADKLCDCSSKQSKEHLISNGILNEGGKFSAVTLWGFKYCENDIREFGISSVASRILCTHHNNILSNVDTAAIRAYSIIQKLDNLVRNPELVEKDQVISYDIDGCLLERWFLKTAINMLYVELDINKPPIDLINMAYGLKRFPEKAGLYLADSFRIPVYDYEDGIKFSFTMENDTTLGMSLFEFRGWKFALPLNGKPIYSLDHIGFVPLGFPPVDRFNQEFIKSGLTYHPIQLVLNLCNNGRFKINFDWKSSKPKECINDFNAWHINKKIVFYGDPVAIDSNDNHVLCKIKINKKGKCQVIIPQDFLDTAKYPVKIKWEFCPNRQGVLKFYEKSKKY